MFCVWRVKRTNLSRKRPPLWCPEPPNAKGVEQRNARAEKPKEQSAAVEKEQSAAANRPRKEEPRGDAAVKRHQ